MFINVSAFLARHDALAIYCTVLVLHPLRLLIRNMGRNSSQWRILS